MIAGPSPNPINPAAIPLADAAKLLAKVGSFAVTEAMLQADVVAGAPANPDGTLNLVHYAAWLVRELIYFALKSTRAAFVLSTGRLHGARGRRPYINRQ